MATPKEALTGTDHTININSNAKASPKNRTMDNQDTVTFKNNDPNYNATVTFLGAGAGELSYNGSPVTSVTVAANGGTTGPLTPITASVTVDYKVQAGVDTGGPFSIQVGTGPLEIDITDDDGDTNLEDAAIPNNGTLFFKNQSTDDTATINFGGDQNVLYDQNGNPVTSQKVGPSTWGAPLTGKGSNKNVTYSVSMSLETDGGLGGGNGTIKVGQT
jgi:hypothetical protein